MLAKAFIYLFTCFAHTHGSHHKGWLAKDNKGTKTLRHNASQNRC